jgi:hypothetical protein
MLTSALSPRRSTGLELMPPNLKVLVSHGKSHNKADENMTLVVRSYNIIAGCHSAWRMAGLLPAGLPDSHRNGGRVFLIFVADPTTVRLSNEDSCIDVGKVTWGRQPAAWWLSRWGSSDRDL